MDVKKTLFMQAEIKNGHRSARFNFQFSLG